MHSLGDSKGLVVSINLKISILQVFFENYGYMKIFANNFLKTLIALLKREIGNYSADIAPRCGITTR